MSMDQIRLNSIHSPSSSPSSHATQSKAVVAKRPAKRAGGNNQKPIGKARPEIKTVGEEPGQLEA
jgi:hypothetical protein